ncbi:DEAD/DEAH box helicase [Neptunicella marina]|uniref:ATP-dependent RNA helicase RhlE n=1 Tax=Neptunicella marina TaxID=2125989 RepID=A0A8J6ITT3_9ALTE|nr:DEAD/DEAH box helicase [Neptunicella marina]MBC3766546.1 DEAD/DEAH box helicase [Neptunicella marina]
MSFESLGLSAPILRAVKQQGYDTPSPIQQQAIPAVLAGRDLMAAAQTGTGKTAGFTLPVLHLLAEGHKARANQVRCLILTPTRELAAQVAENVTNYGQFTGLNSEVVFGGVKINPQMMRLRRGADILVATPGRLLDLYQQNAVRFDHLEVLVLDEADRMLDMGFFRDIKKILQILPAKRQNLLFSATFSNEIRDLAKGLLNNPLEVSVAPANSTAESVEQWVYPVDKSQKSPLLTHLITDGNWQQVLVFTRTKHGANRLVKQLLAKGISAAAIHGNKSQGARTKALADFKQNDVRILVATDIAARGLDIDKLPYVINYDLPHVSEDYVHRIGRTGRAGACGQALSLVTADDFDNLKGIENLIGKLIERKQVRGFEPQQVLPASKLSDKVKKPKKPKKPKQKSQNDGERTQPKPQNNNNSARKGAEQTQATAKKRRRFRPRKPNGANNNP